MSVLISQSVINYVEEENIPALKALLEKCKDVDERNECGQTPLMIAAEQGNLEIVKELIKNGANCNLEDLDNWTALISASKEGHVHIVEELLRCGADSEHHDMGGWTALMWACYKGRTEVVELLLSHGTNPSVTGLYSIYPIIWAAGRGHSDIVHLLLQSGAKVNCSDKYGTTPLVWAARKGHLECVRHLLASGADVDQEGANSDLLPWDQLKNRPDSAEQSGVNGVKFGHLHSTWYLSNEGVEACTSSPDKVSVNDIILIALNTDLRTIGKKFLPSDINGGKVEKLEGPCVLQIQKIRNVAAPKDNEESQAAPRMLRLQMTDGHISCTAVEYSYMSKISLNTPPGTKVKLSGTVDIKNGFLLSGTVDIKNGFLLLNDSNTTVLGGEVEHLIEKWELQRSLSKHNRSNIGTEGGPPPFVPFGQKCVSHVQMDSRELDRRKTLQVTMPVKPANDNDEFEKQRTAAIAEVAKSKEVSGDTPVVLTESQAYTLWSNVLFPNPLDNRIKLLFLATTLLFFFSLFF